MELKLTDPQENYPCELASLMPRTFGNYLLPAFDVPVYHQEVELDRIDIPTSGELSMDIPTAICSRLKNGSLFIKPVTEVVTVESLHRLHITGIVLTDAI